MIDKKFIETARELISRECISSGINPIQIFLFGSRAKGTYHQEGDWDFMVIINQELTFGQRARLTAKIRRIFSSIGINADIILKSEKKFKQERYNTGLISYYVFNEGVIL